MNKNHLLALLASILLPACSTVDTGASAFNKDYMAMSCAELGVHAKEARALRDAPKAEALAHQHRHGMKGIDWNQELASIEAAQAAPRCSAHAGHHVAQ